MSALAVAELHEPQIFDGNICLIVKKNQALVQTNIFLTLLDICSQLSDGERPNLTVGEHVTMNDKSPPIQTYSIRFSYNSLTYKNSVNDGHRFYGMKRFNKLTDFDSMALMLMHIFFLVGNNP